MPLAQGWQQYMSKNAKHGDLLAADAVRPAPDSYWVQSRGPLASLVFLAPLLIVYEAGTMFFGVRNGADELMRRLLNVLGFGQHFLLPLLTICILLAWHYLSREPWRLSGSILSAMTAEAILLGAVLFAVSFVQRHC